MGSAASKELQADGGEPGQAGAKSATKLSKVEQAKARFCGLDLEPRLADLAAQGWQSLDEETLTIHLKWLGIFFRPVTPGRFMVRLRPS